MFTPRFTSHLRTMVSAAVVVGIFGMTGSATAVPWYLDRLDQRNLPLDGWYNPCASGTGAHIYIVSSGLEHWNPEFGNRASYFWDWDPLNGGHDNVGHGTWLASLAAGQTYGVAKNASLYSVRAFDDCGRTTVGILENALDSIIAGGASSQRSTVVLPFAFEDVPELDALVDDLWNAGYIVVTAGGDQNRNACELSPARSQAITVGACNSSDERPAWAAYGSCVDVYAPGAAITAAWIGPEGTATIDTSGASAALAGGVAAIYQGIGMNRPDVDQTLRSCTGGSSIPLLRLCCDGGGPGPGPGPVVAGSVPGQTPGAPLDWYRLVDDFVVCTADFDADCKVGFSDLTMLLAEWGPCPPGVACPLDLDGNGDVGFADLTDLLSSWGDCP